MSRQAERRVSAADLAAAVAALFVAAGLDQTSAEVVADDLVRADVEGLPSHGVMLVPLYLDRMRGGSISTEPEGAVVSDRGGAVVLDARNGFGQLTAHQAVRLAAERAGRFGLGAVAVRNAQHFGAAGRYAQMIAERGAVGIVMSNTRPLMPAPGGAEPVVGNNPIAFAVPSAGDVPVKHDLATSASAMGRIRLADAAGEPIPEGWAADRDGNPTTDPAAAIKGMLLPAAGPKGFGLAFMIDLLCGGLSSGGVGAAVRPLYGDVGQPYNCSHFFLAVDVGHFREPGEFAAVAAENAARVAASRRAPGIDRVFSPGERSFATREAAGGTCRVAAPTVAALLAAGGKAGVDLTSLFGEERRSR